MLSVILSCHVMLSMGKVDSWDMLINFLFSCVSSKEVVCHAVMSRMSNTYFDPWNMPSNFCINGSKVTVCR